MASPILSVENLRTIVAPLVAQRSRDLPAVLLPSHRTELVQTLTDALLGPVSCQEYCSFLEAQRIEQGNGPLPDLLIGDFPIADLLRDGLSVLSDDRLVQLALSPRALCLLQDLVGPSMMEEGLIGASWRRAWDEIADALPVDDLAEQAKRRALARIAQMRTDFPTDPAAGESQHTVSHEEPRSVGSDLDRLVEEALKQVRNEIHQSTAEQAEAGGSNLSALSARQIASRIVARLASQLPPAIVHSRECMQAIARLVNAASRDEARRALSNSTGESQSAKLTVVGDSSTSTLLTAAADPQRVLTELDRLDALRGEYPHVADIYGCWRFAGRTVSELSTLFGLPEDELDADLKFAVHRIKD